MVEIIPKPTVKKIPWQNILLYLSIILLLAVVLGFFFLDNAIERSSSLLRDLEERLAEEIPGKAALERSILGYQRKIDDLVVLLPERRLASAVFEVLESGAHPEIWYSEAVFSVEDSSMNVSGFTESFQALGQQAIVLRENALVRIFELQKVSLGEAEGISFDFSIIFEPEALR